MNPDEIKEFEVFSTGPQWTRGQANAFALAAAEKLMRGAMTGNARGLPAAIEAMIDAKVAIAIEALADRIQDASGVRP